MRVKLVNYTPNVYCCSNSYPVKRPLPADHVNMPPR